MIFSKVCINFSPVLLGGGWVVGGKGWGWEEAKAPQVNTRGQLPTDGPDHTTKPKGHHSGPG